MYSGMDKEDTEIIVEITEITKIDRDSMVAYFCHEIAR